MTRICFIYRACVILFLILIVRPLWADRLLVEPDMGRQPIIDIINQAQYSIDLVMYGFTDQTLLNKLIQQKNNGRSLKIILEDSPYKAPDENKKTIATLNAQQIPWQGSIPPFRLVHQKTLIADHTKAVIMTFNFTRSTFKNERNFALIIDDPARVNDIATIFSADWNHVAVTNQSPDLLLSPDDSRSKLLTLINQANHRLQIYAQNVSDYKIVGALAKAARKGVQVQLITSTKLRDKQANYLSRAGVSIHYTKKLIIHAKVFIIDNKKAVIGSINLTRASLDNNRELSIVTEDANVMKTLTTTFNHDWNDADPFSTPISLPKIKQAWRHFKFLLPDRYVH